MKSFTLNSSSIDSATTIEISNYSSFILRPSFGSRILIYYFTKPFLLISCFGGRGTNNKMKIKRLLFPNT